MAYWTLKFELNADVLPVMLLKDVLVAVTHWPADTPETGTTTDVPVAEADPMSVLPSPYSVPLPS
jgi:hypothetical protein